jgi:NitT/TauT family transport system ATP-binding protein
MQELLRNTLDKFKDMAILFVTHDIFEAVYLSDEIYFMKSNPGEIVDKVDVKFTMKRTPEIKREKQFLNKVYEVEDTLSEISI